jgi:PAS domain S-box-containing protein
VVVRCNRRYAEIFGYLHPQDMEGISSANFHPTRTEFRELGRTAYPTLSRGEVFKTERLMRRKNGRLFWGALTGRLINPDDTREGSIWIIDDIDEQKRSQSLLGNALREKQLLLTTRPLALRSSAKARSPAATPIWNRCWVTTLASCRTSTPPVSSPAPRPGSSCSTKARAYY